MYIYNNDINETSMKHLTFSSLILCALVSVSCASEPDTSKDKAAIKAPVVTAPAVVAPTVAASETSTPETTKVSHGKEVYEKYCIACHVSEGKPTIAPPIFAVKNHVMDKYPERADFVKRVSEWVKAPNADDVIMRGAVGKFGVMPAMPYVSDEDAQAVAEFLFDSNMALPDWYAEHYKEEHGEAPKAH